MPVQNLVLSGLSIRRTDLSLDLALRNARPVIPYTTLGLADSPTLFSPTGRKGRNRQQVDRFHKSAAADVTMFAPFPNSDQLHRQTDPLVQDPRNLFMYPW